MQAHSETITGVVNDERQATATLTSLAEKFPEEKKGVAAAQKAVAGASTLYVSHDSLSLLLFLSRSLFSSLSLPLSLCLSPRGVNRRC